MRAPYAALLLNRIPPILPHTRRNLILTTITNHKTAPPDRRPIVISGPSGVGKGTLYNRLREEHPDCFAFSVSHTSRGPREGEQDGVHYHYIPMQEFEDLIAKDAFVEHAKFGGNRYGTSKMTIEEQTKKGLVVLLDIEMEVSWKSSDLFKAPSPFLGGGVSPPLQWPDDYSTPPQGISILYKRQHRLTNFLFLGYKT